MRFKTPKVDLMRLLVIFFFSPRLSVSLWDSDRKTFGEELIVGFSARGETGGLIGKENLCFMLRRDEKFEF